MTKILSIDSQILYQEKGIDLKSTLESACDKNISLKGAYLLKGNFNSASLNGIDLRNADLRGANLSAAWLTNANLRGANLNGANLNGANLSGANLIETDLTNASMYHTDLRGAALHEAKLINTDLQIASLMNCTFGKTIILATKISHAWDIEYINVQSKCYFDLDSLKDITNLPAQIYKKFGFSQSIAGEISNLLNSQIKDKPSVFISHSWDDKEFARLIYNELIRNDINCWFDEKETYPGDRIIGSITEGIKSTDKMLLICSKKSLTSWWVEREIERLIQKEKEFNHNKLESERRNVLIPITIDDYIFSDSDFAWKPEITRYTIGDFQDWKNNDEFRNQLERLVKTIKKHR